MPAQGRTLTFTGHLEELRKRLIISVVSWLVATALAFPLAPKAIGLLGMPLQLATTPKDPPRIILSFVSTDSGGNSYQLAGRFENLTTDTKRLDQVQVDLELPWGEIRSIGEGAVTGSNLYYRNLIDPIWLILKAALILGIILALPIWVYQIWAFVKPGLKKSEVRIVRPLFAMCAVLFPLGVGFAYFMLQMVIKFLLSIQIANVAPLLDISNYIGLALRLMIGFGLVFELPVAILLLARLGVVTPAWLRQYRAHGYVAIAVVAMLVTPPDPISMVVMMGPLFFLYELSIWLSYFAARSREKALEEEEFEDEENEDEED